MAWRCSSCRPHIAARATVSRSPIPAPISPARSITPTTASGATTKARTPARSGSKRRAASSRRARTGGCPLDEKISEMNLVEVGGHTIGALAIVVVDNPMCAATGHRICNDCMKACIYQKQEPVDIPQVETRILKDVLALPWGFEIYGL